MYIIDDHVYIYMSIICVYDHTLSPSISVKQHIKPNPASVPMNISLAPYGLCVWVSCGNIDPIWAPCGLACRWGKKRSKNRPAIN